MRISEVLVSEEELLDEWSGDVLASVGQNPRFKSWFGASKVVDKSGLPMPVFHYTTNTFDISQFKPFSHFGTDKAALARWQYTNKMGKTLGRVSKNNIAAVQDIDQKDVMHKSQYYWRRDRDIEGDKANANVSDTNLLNHNTVPVFLRIVKPLTIIDDGTQHDDTSYFEMLQAKGLISPDIKLSTRYAIKAKKEARTYVLNAMADHGYDGFVYRNTAEHKGSLSWIILSPDQVKSVFDFLGRNDE